MTKKSESIAPIVKNRFTPRTRVTSNTRGPSLALQSSKDECDINKILDKYKNTGVIDHVAKAQAQYTDFSMVEDYHSALNAVIAAESAFNALPAHIRARFDHDPAKLVEFVSDNKNYDEAATLGLVPAKVIKPTQSPDGSPIVDKTKTTEPK